MSRQDAHGNRFTKNLNLGNLEKYDGILPTQMGIFINLRYLTRNIIPWQSYQSHGVFGPSEVCVLPLS